MLPVEGTRKARISFADDGQATIEVRLAPTTTPPPSDPTVTVNRAATDVVVDVPFGIWDVYLKADNRTAVLLAQVAAPGPEGVSWGIAELAEGDNVCGDARVGGIEACDNGAANSDTLADACRTNCTRARCGDGVQDRGEACDAGEANSNLTPNGCRAACVLPRCGDGVVDSGEACDDGLANNNDTLADACRTSCQVASFGDGVVDTGEVCDTGAARSDTLANACRTTCQEPSCGDGVVDDGEICDTADARSDTEPDACRVACVLPECGDGVVDSEEACDNGPENSDTALGACRTNCVEAFCGDGVADPGEVCDNGAENSDVAPDSCRTSCLFAFCGDGTVDSGEECDDGGANATTCEPVDGESCSFCDSRTCSVRTIAESATVVVVVGSAQFFGVNPLPGVRVRFDGNESSTDAAGVARISVPVPVEPGAVIVVGDSLDPRLDTHAHGHAIIKVPETLESGQELTRRVRLMEECALTQVGNGGGSISDECPKLQMELGWFSDSDALVDEVTGDPIDAQALYQVRASTIPFDDLDAALGYPDTVATDGSTISCDNVFSLRIDGADIAPIASGNRFLVFPDNGIISQASFFFDETIGAFVERGEIGEGDVVIDAEGVWCLGSTISQNSCLLVSAPAAAGISEDLNLDIVSTGRSGVTRSSALLPVDGQVCVPGDIGTNVVIETFTLDGRRGKTWRSQGHPTVWAAVAQAACPPSSPLTMAPKTRASW